MATEGWEDSSDRHSVSSAVASMAGDAELVGERENGPRDHEKANWKHGEEEERTTNSARHLTRVWSG